MPRVSERFMGFGGTFGLGVGIFLNVGHGMKVRLGDSKEGELHPAKSS